MSEPHERLAQARAAAGYSSATSAAEAHGWTPSTYLGHENGTRGLRAATAAIYAKAFDVEPSWLLYGESWAAAASGGGDSSEPTPMAQRAMERLTALGLTPITAATRAGLDRDLFRNMFRTGSYPRADTLASLCQVLGVSADWLLFGADAPPSDAQETTVRSYSMPSAGVSVTATPSGRVDLNLQASVSISTARQILALIEGDRP